MDNYVLHHGLRFQALIIQDRLYFPGDNLRSVGESGDSEEANGDK